MSFVLEQLSKNRFMILNVNNVNVAFLVVTVTDTWRELSELTVKLEEVGADLIYHTIIKSMKMKRSSGGKFFGPIVYIF